MACTPVRPRLPCRAAMTKLLHSIGTTFNKLGIPTNATDPARVVTEPREQRKEFHDLKAPWYHVLRDWAQFPVFSPRSRLRPGTGLLRLWGTLKKIFTGQAHSNRWRTHSR